MVSQAYVTEAENEYVIRGNSAVMKCKIPSFVADFVTIDAWVADSGETHMYSRGQSQTDYGKCSWDRHRPLTARSLSLFLLPSAGTGPLHVAAFRPCRA